MGDSQRAFGAGVQSAAGTAASSITWFSFVEEFSHKPNLTFDVPKFKTNQRWMERKAIAKTRYEEVTVKGRVDGTEFPILLESALGTPASGVYKAGGSNNHLLTLKWSEGIYTGSNVQTWTMIDARVNTLEYTVDAANGTVTYNATLRGPATTVANAAPPSSYTHPTSTIPFGAWETVLMRTSTALCVVTARWQINNNYDPFYCTPLAMPAAGALAGLAPSRFTEGEVTGTFDITYEYTGESTPAPKSSFYDFRYQIEEAWHLHSADPNGTTDIVIDIPIVCLTSGELDRSKPNVLQHVSGTILYSDTDLTGLVVTVTP